MKILVAVPTRGWIHYKVASAISKFEAKGFPVIMSQSSYGVEAARKRLLMHFLDFPEYEYILFLDDDVIPPSDIVAKLLRHGKHFVSASYPIAYDGKLLDSSATWNGREYEKLDLANVGMMKVAACGLGACLLSRKLITDSYRPDCLGIEYDENGEVEKGEDYKFCEVAIRSGFDIWVDFDTKCEHYKYIPIGKGVL